MQILFYTAAIGAHTVLMSVFWMSVLWFVESPAFQAVALLVGTTLIAFSAWQSIRGIRAGEPLGEALCWMMD